MIRKLFLQEDFKTGLTQRIRIQVALPSLLAACMSVGRASLLH